MSFLAELKRRNVFKVGIAYAVAAWILLQMIDVVGDILALPEWVPKFMLLLLVVGMVPALIFAWAFEMTPDGVKREKNVDRNQSITPRTGKKLNNAIVVLLALAVAYLLYDKFSASERTPVSVSQEAAMPGNEASVGEKNLRPAPLAGADHSIAVLPFANRSRDEDDAFFSDGIHDDLLTQLAKISDLKVISRTSVMKYKGTQMTIPEIAAELNVSTILEGGIQRAGNRIRVNAQLIDVATDEHLWAESFDREMTMDNIFDIQSEITRQIVTAVKGELSEEEQQSLRSAPTGNLLAYEAFLHARAATNRSDYSKEKYLEAQPWAEKAVQLDPGFADAWAILAEIHAQAMWLGYDNTAERRASAREALANATRLDPQSAAVKAAQADYLYRFENNYGAALAMYREAHEMAPGDARILLYMAITLRRHGLWQESIEAFEASMQLDPANVFAATQMVDTLTWMQAWDRVESLLGDWIIKYPDSSDLKGQLVMAQLFHHGDLTSARELFDLLQPWSGYVYVNAATSLLNFERNFDALLQFIDSPYFAGNTQYGDDSELNRGKAYHLMGDEARARMHFQKQVDLTLAEPPTGTFVDAFRLASRAISWSYLDEYDKSLEAIREAMQMLPQKNDHIFGAQLERIYTLLLARAGQRDEALERLAESADKTAGITRWELYLSPEWDFFRDDERFNELARPLNLVEAGQ